VEDKEASSLDRNNLLELLGVAGQSLGNALGDLMEFKVKQTEEWYESPDGAFVEELEEKLGLLVEDVYHLCRMINP
jgi:hypothetical protein